mgnify:CR=1 FL=1
MGTPTAAVVGLTFVPVGYLFFCVSWVMYGIMAALVIGVTLTRAGVILIIVGPRPPDAERNGHAIINHS